MDKNRYFQIRSGKYIKTKVADIQRLYSKWLWLVTVVYKPSFADAERPLRFCRSTGGPDIRENCEWPSVIRPQYPGRAKPYDRTGREYARSVWLYVFSLSFRGANVRPDAVGGLTDRKERFCPVTDHSAPVCQPPPNAL